MPAASELLGDDGPPRARRARARTCGFEIWRALPAAGISPPLLQAQLTALKLKTPRPPVPEALARPRDPRAGLRRSRAKHPRTTISRQVRRGVKTGIHGVLLGAVRAGRVARQGRV